jgi:hypothetical protein
VSGERWRRKEICEEENEKKREDTIMELKSKKRK